jgi:hypothetical protein
MNALKISREAVKTPKQKFNKFYKRQNSVAELVETKEWEIYAQFYDFDQYELEIQINPEEDPETFDEQRQLEEFEKCALSFFYFCHKYVKIFHPTEGLLPCILYKYQRFVIKCYEDNRFSIISKFRQGGLTTIAVLWGLWRAMFRTDQKIMVLSKTDREAIAAGEIAKRALEYFPSWLKPKMDGMSKHEKIFQETGSSLYFYTPEAARGKSVTVLIIDEAAFIDDMESHWKAMYPTISTGGSCFVISTVNGLGNWYEEQYHEAESGKNEFKVIDLDYWLHPEYCAPNWEKTALANMGEKAFQQEILRNFLGSGDTYIPPHIIRELDEQTRDKEPLRILFPKWANKEERVVDWEAGALWIWKEPKDGCDYIIGVDCAEGVGDDGDNSCFQVLNMQTMEQCAEFISNRVPPNIFSQIIQQIGVYYNVALVVVENNAIGSAVASNLHVSLGYENLYHEIKKRTDARPGVKIGLQNRPVYLEALQNRLINGNLLINSRRFVSELTTFRFDRRKKRAEAQKGRHDDCIMALCIALYTRDMMMHDLPVGIHVPEETTAVFKSEMFELIKREILKDTPDNELEGDEELPDPFYIEQTEDETGLALGFRRRNSAILSEFGWVIFLALWLVNTIGV